jgi:hypothetical protein
MGLGGRCWMAACIMQQTLATHQQDPNPARWLPGQSFSCCPKEASVRLRMLLSYGLDVGKFIPPDAIHALPL